VFIKGGGFKYAKVVDRPKKFLLEFKKKVRGRDGCNIKRG